MEEMLNIRLLEEAAAFFPKGARGCLHSWRHVIGENLFLLLYKSSGPRSAHVSGCHRITPIFPPAVNFYGRRVKLTRGFSHHGRRAGSHCSSHPLLDGRCGLRPGAHCGVVARAHESQPPLLLEGWLGRHIEPLRVPGRPKAVESATLGRRPSAAAASVRYPSREGSPAEGQKGWP